MAVASVIDLILAGLHFEGVSSTLAQGMEIEASWPAAVIGHELAAQVGAVRGRGPG